MDAYRSSGYGTLEIGFGERPGIVVVDFQTAFTDPQYPLGKSEMIGAAVDGTARLLAAARRRGVPVAACFTAYHSERDMPYWKISSVVEQFRIDHPGSALDPRIHDPHYDVVVRKTGPSIFFQTPVVPFFTRERVDTVIVTGCTTSGCVRASVIDSFQYGYRTIIARDCVGDMEEGPHDDNLRDMERRYADVKTGAEIIAWLETLPLRNA